MIQIYEPEQFENGWGFYVDIETQYTTNSKQNFIKEKYPTNYYGCHDKIDEELEYYVYNKKNEEPTDLNNKITPLQENNVTSNKSLLSSLAFSSSSLLFNISAVALVTTALSYCFGIDIYTIEDLKQPPLEKLSV